MRTIINNDVRSLHCQVRKKISKQPENMFLDNLIGVKQKRQYR